MSLPLTAVLAGLALILTLVFGWLGARPARPLAAPRLIPWRVLMATAFALAAALGVHIVALVRGPAP
jgi:hypothetical protein